jgi:putative endonuclease
VASNGRAGSTPARGTESDVSRFFLYMYFVYILYSEKCDRYYIGYCSDIEARLHRHNSGMVTATRNCRPYIIKAIKAFSFEVEARKEELRIKKQKSRKYLEWLIETWTRPD